MPETLVQFQSPVSGPDGLEYIARACGAPMDDGMWEGWVEFDPVGGGETVASPRETTQPNRTDTVYWATGLTAIFLEGSLRRALDAPIRVRVPIVRAPVYDGPAPSTMPTVASSEPPAAGHAILDPFSVYQKGEALLRKQLAALSSWHLVNIILEYELSDEPVETLNTQPAAALIETIVSRVREESLLRG